MEEPGPGTEGQLALVAAVVDEVVADVAVGPVPGHRQVEVVRYWALGANLGPGVAVGGDLTRMETEYHLAGDAGLRCAVAAGADRSRVTGGVHGQEHAIEPVAFQEGPVKALASYGGAEYFLLQESRRVHASHLEQGPGPEEVSSSSHYRPR